MDQTFVDIYIYIDKKFEMISLQKLACSLSWQFKISVSLLLEHTN